MAEILELGEAPALLKLAGEVNISCAAELKERMLRTLKAGEHLTVSLERVAGMDVTAVQLLWACQRAAELAGAGVDYAGFPADEVAARLVEMGFDEFVAWAMGNQLGGVRNCQS